jgi:hypothetical protein
LEHMNFFSAVHAADPIIESSSLAKGRDGVSL